MKNKNFPQATKSIAKAKLDLKEWGYCLLKDAIPTDLNDELSKRLVEQANAEKPEEALAEVVVFFIVPFYLINIKIILAEIYNPVNLFILCGENNLIG